MARDVSQELLGSDSSEHELLNPTHSLVDEIFLASPSLLVWYPASFSRLFSAIALG